MSLRRDDTLTTRFGLFANIAMAASLSACGGGGSGMVAALPPAPTVTSPTPAPTPTTPSTVNLGTAGPANMSAPERASVGVAGPAIFAVSGGPNFRSGAVTGTQFPVLQTIMVADPTINTIAPDKASMAAGFFAAINAQHQLDSSPRFGLIGYGDLDWTRVGSWNDGGVWDYSGVGHRAFYVAGYQTPTASIPVTGTATFTGIADGEVFLPVPLGSGMIHANANDVDVKGTASLTADFALRSVVGTLTNMTNQERSTPWNSVAFTSIISANGFSGSTSVTSAPAMPETMLATATGTIEGTFFGPAAQEVGAVWTLYDGTNSAIGSISAKRP